MKSIAERKRERDAKERKQRMKRSVGASGIYRRFNIPAYRLGWAASEGDLAFLKKKAEHFIKVCKSVAPHQFYRYLKDIILEEERLIKEEREKRDAAWAARLAAQAAINTLPTVPATTPAPVTVSGEGSTQVVTNAVPAPAVTSETSTGETTEWTIDPDFNNLVFSNVPPSIDHIRPLRRRRRN